jgi:hypothetical protein
VQAFDVEGANNQPYVVLSGGTLSIPWDEGVLCADDINDPGNLDCGKRNYDPEHPETATQALTAQLVSQPPSGQGTVTVNTDGSFVFTAAPDFFGQTFFRINVIKAGFVSLAATVYMQVARLAGCAADSGGPLRRVPKESVKPHVGNSIAGYQLSWSQFILSKTYACDVEIVQLINVSGLKVFDDGTTRSFAGSYYEDIGTIPVRGRRLSREDSWVFDGLTQPNAGPKLENVKIVQTGFASAWEKNADLDAALATWQPFLQIPFDQGQWTSGEFPASPTFDAQLNLRLLEDEDRVHVAINRWTKPYHMKFYVDGKLWGDT